MVTTASIKADDFTGEEVAALRGISLKTLRRMIDRGHAPHGVRIGNTVRFDRQTILGWLESNTVVRGGNLAEVRAGIDAETR